MGIVYLIQPAYCEHEFKIGFSRKNDMSRLQSYPVKSDIYRITRVDNADEVECALLRAFRDRFVQSTRGTEYFETHSIREMCNLFDETVRQYGVVVENQAYSPNNLVDFEIAYDYVYNNVDFPEHATVRKPNKKDDLIHVNVGEGVWEARLSHTMIPVIVKNLEEKLQVKLTNVPRGSRAILDMMYRKTKEGPKTF